MFESISNAILFHQNEKAAVESFKKVTEISENLLIFFQEKSQFIDAVVKSWLIILSLLQDEDEDLRDVTASYVSVTRCRLNGGEEVGEHILASIYRTVHVCDRSSTTSQN